MPSIDTDFEVVGRDIDFDEALPSTASSAVAVANGAAAFRSSVRPLAATRLKFFVHGMDYSPTQVGQPVNNNPLGSGNSAIWSRDIPLMRNLGVNVIHIYNVDPNVSGPIDNALAALWNNGTKPIYVVFSIHFGATCLNSSGCANDLAGQYYRLDKQYAKNPAVMGVTISNEINPCSLSVDPNCAVPSNATYWGNFNIIAKQAKQGFADGGDRNKLVLTSNVDDNNYTLSQGAQFGAAVDAWGINVYRGRGISYSNQGAGALFAQIRATTSKPVVLTEYGGTAGWHPKGSAGKKYVYPQSDGTGVCKPVGGAPYAVTDIAQMPATGNISMAGLNDLITFSNTQLYQGWRADGVVSGGFYFEWTDEWWKQTPSDPKSRSVHLGNANVVDSYPACARDEAWYGLNAIAAGTVLTPRTSLTALKNVWANQLTALP
ncbi:MAG: hypothetical protein ACLQPV_11515 [Vulcanimicrobiaceae bacterium]